MRTIKFRAWDTFDKKMVYFSLGEGIRLHDRIVTQFTGLLDKNGKEIYLKSDITEARKGDFVFRDTVEFGWSQRGDAYGLVWSKTKNPVTTWDCIEKDFEVIGNVYENPDLISLAE